MTEENKFKKVATIQLYSDIIGAVSLYDASHANESEEQRIWTVTTLASLAYGNEEAKQPEALYKRMQSIRHESLWEFIRIGNDYFSPLGYDMRNFMHADNYQYPYEVASTHSQNIACFRIKVPMFVRSQFMRHRSASYLEMSRRYTKGAKIPFEFWSPVGFVYDSAHALNEYQSCIDAGMETQIASRFLPQTTYTEFYCMFEVEGLANFLRLRLDSHAQAEIRETAVAMLELLRVHQPTLYAKISHINRTTHVN